MPVTSIGAIDEDDYGAPVFTTEAMKRVRLPDLKSNALQTTTFGPDRCAAKRNP
jgi:hypothetical protein